MVPFYLASQYYLWYTDCIIRRQEVLYMILDKSIDYGSYPTLAPLPEGMLSDKGYIECPICGGSIFRLQRIDRIPVCIGCGYTLEPIHASEKIPSEDENLWQIPDDMIQDQASDFNQSADFQPLPQIDDAPPPRFQIVRGPDHTVILRPDGTLKAVGNNKNGQCNVQNWTGITAVATNQYYTVGLCENGTVMSTASGLLYIGIRKEFSSWKNVTTIGAGSNFTVARCADGTVKSAGIRLPAWSGITAIDADGFHIVALCEDGSVRAVGTPSIASKVHDWSRIKDIATGVQHTVGLCEDGTVKAVGFNRKSKHERIPRCDVGNWSRIKSIDAGKFHTVGLDEDGRVHAVGMNANGQCNVSEWRDVVAICADATFTAGLRADGTVLCTDPTILKLLEEIYN